MRVNSLLTVTFNDAYFVGHAKKNFQTKIQETQNVVPGVKPGLIEATAHNNFTKQIEQVATQIRHILLLIALCLCIYSI